LRLVSARSGAGILLFFLTPVALQVLLSLGALIPVVGPLFQWLAPMLAFFVYFFVGAHAADLTKSATSVQRTLVAALALVVGTCAFASPYVVEYFTLPIRVSRNVLEEQEEIITYQQASREVRTLLRKDMGSDGVLASAIYSERRQLTAQSYGEYFSKQFEDLDDLGGLVAAVVNSALHAIPMTLKLVLCDKLEWVGEPGAVGLVFWYLVAMALVCFGYGGGKRQRL
jgi:hypothetical protein